MISTHLFLRRKAYVWQAGLLIVVIAGVLAGYTYYFRRTGASEIPGNAQTGDAGAAALYFTNGQAENSGYATSGYQIPTSVLDNDFTIKLTIKGGDWDAAIGHYPFLTMENQDGLRRFRFGRQNSPYGEVFMNKGSADQGAESSPGGMDETSFHVPVTGVVDSTLTKGSLSRQVYSDYWFVYKKPTATTDGYLRVYRNGDMHRVSITAAGIYSIPIPAGSATDWTGDSAKPYRIRLGSKSNPVEDFKVAEVALWTDALDSDMVSGGCDTWVASNPRCDSRDWGIQTENRTANPTLWTLYYSPALRNLSKKPVALMDASTRYESKLYFDFYVTDAGIATSSPIGLSAGSASSDLSLSRSASSSLSADVPGEWPEWGKAASNGPQSLSVDATVSGDTSIHIATLSDGVSTGSLAGTPLVRNVYVSKSQYLYRTAPVFSRTGGQDVTNLDVTGLEPGTEYYVVGEWVDLLGTRGTCVVPLRTTGSKAVLSADRKSIHLTGTASTPSSNFALPVNEPFTMRVYLKRGAGDSGTTGKIIDVQDSLSNTTGYSRFNLGVSGTQFTATLTDGSKRVSEYTPSNAYVVGDWMEVWLQYNPPTAFAPGVFRVLKGTQVLQTAILDPVADWFTDWDFKKFKLHLRIGDEATARDVYIGPLAWWTRYLDDNEIAALSGKDIGQLSENSRYESDLYWYAQPSQSGTAIIPDLGTSVGAQGISVPLSGNALAFDSDYPSLSGPSPDQTPPTADALSLNGGPGQNGATLTVPKTDSSVVRRVVHVFHDQGLSRRNQRVGSDTVLSDTATTTQITGLYSNTTYYAYATYYDATGNHADSPVSTFKTLDPVAKTLSLEVLLRGRVPQNGVLATANHAHSAIMLDLRTAADAPLGSPVSCMAASASNGTVSVTSTGSGCGALVTYIADHPGTTYHLVVWPSGYLYQTVAVSDASLDGASLTFAKPFVPGAFAAVSPQDHVQLADFSILAAYYNGGDGSAGVAQAFMGRGAGSLLGEFAALAYAFNGGQ